MPAPLPLNGLDVISFTALEKYRFRFLLGIAFPLSWPRCAGSKRNFPDLCHFLIGTEKQFRLVVGGNPEGIFAIYRRSEKSVHAGQIVSRPICRGFKGTCYLPAGRSVRV